jgi:hypothetical protein
MLVPTQVVPLTLPAHWSLAAVAVNVWLTDRFLLTSVILTVKARAVPSVRPVGVVHAKLLVNAT